MRFKHEFLFPFRCGQTQTFTPQIQMCGSDSDSDSEPFKKQTPPNSSSPILSHIFHTKHILILTPELDLGLKAQSELTTFFLISV